MKVKKILVFLVVMLMGITGLKAQDQIFIRGEKKPMNVKVIEIGTDEIVFQNSNNNYTETVEKMDVTKIVFGDGSVRKFDIEEGTLDRYRHMHINAFTLDFFGLAGNQLGLSYERVLKPGHTYELDFSFIGIGGNREIYTQYHSVGSPTIYYDDPQGFRLGGGYKFTRLPDFVQGRTRYRHLMQGSYVKPWINFESISRNFLDSIVYNPNTGESIPVFKRASINSVNLGFNLGRSYVLSNRILMDFYFGIGYSISNYKKIADDDPNDYYSFDQLDYVGYGYLRIQPNKSNPLILTGGLKFGYLFNWNKDNDIDVFK